MDDRIKSIEYLLDNDTSFEKILDTLIEYTKYKNALMTLIAYLKSKNYDISKNELEEMITNLINKDLRRCCHRKENEEKHGELLHEKFDDEVKIYKFLNKISKDKLVKIVSIVRLSGPEEGNFELYYKFLNKNLEFLEN